MQASPPQKTQASPTSTGGPHDNLVPAGTAADPVKGAEHACQPHASTFGQYGHVGREANVRLAEMSGYSFITNSNISQHRASPLW